jgi:hypothetical protein
MHANLRRKEMAINKEGFQGYRAIDDCREDFCPFRQQKSTHFHCIRSSCTFTFKNKADMGKRKAGGAMRLIKEVATHSGVHPKFMRLCRETQGVSDDENDELVKDGFRKYMKYEHCLFESCPDSKIMNHCIRSGESHAVALWFIISPIKKLDAPVRAVGHFST